jgi:hypothetical protein
LPYSATGYERRAEECVRLANLTKDEMLSAELLKLRQSYLVIAARLKKISRDAGDKASGDRP